MRTNYVDGKDVVEQRFLEQIKAGASPKVVDEYLKYVHDRNDRVVGDVKKKVETLELWMTDKEKYGSGYGPALEMYKEFLIVMGTK